MKSLRKQFLVRCLLSVSISASILTLSQNSYAVEKESAQHAAMQQADNRLDLRTQLALSDFVFLGKIIDIQYISSREGIPHTFVTYSIEQPLKGKYDDTIITLRFIGGVKQIEKDHYEMLEVSHMPIFDKESIDKTSSNFIFAHKNGVSMCPLVGCSGGLFKISDKGYVTTDEGKLLAMNDQNELISLAETLTDIDILGTPSKENDSGEKASPFEFSALDMKPLLAQDFIANILKIAEQLPDSTRILSSVELDKAFSVAPLKPIKPLLETEIKAQGGHDVFRNELDRQEEALLKENGNNPVLK